jgi:hypothetical protein
MGEKQAWNNMKQPVRCSSGADRLRDLMLMLRAREEDAIRDKRLPNWLYMYVCKVPSGPRYSQSWLAVSGSRDMCVLRFPFTNISS